MREFFSKESLYSFFLSIIIIIMMKFRPSSNYLEKEDRNKTLSEDILKMVWGGKLELIDSMKIINEWNRRRERRENAICTVQIEVASDKCQLIIAFFSKQISTILPVLWIIFLSIWFENIKSFVLLEIIFYKGKHLTNCRRFTLIAI